MKINGANYSSEEDVQYRQLTDILKPGASIYKYVEYLQNLYYDCVKKVEESTINEISNDGEHVILTPGMTNHRCSMDLDTLRCISKYGILATEWFGILESEREAVFCTFVDKIKPQDNESLVNEDFRRLNSSSENILLFFDDSNDVMKYLIHLDYFEYIRVKNQEPDNLTKLYSNEELELFDNLIGKFSTSITNFHNNSNSLFYYWSAIPGGIPSLLVNGICIKNNEVSEKYINELSILFPNATIFRANLDIIYKPEKNKLKD